MNVVYEPSESCLGVSEVMAVACCLELGLVSTRPGDDHGRCGRRHQ